MLLNTRLFHAYHCLPLLIVFNISILAYCKWLYYLHQLVYLCILSLDQAAVLQMSEPANAVICHATRVFGKTALRKLALENQRYVNAGTNVPPPPKKELRTYIFLDITQVHNARVIDIASFRGSSARLIQIFSVRFICPIVTFRHIW
jgi:hypothetical protein